MKLTFVRLLISLTVDPEDGGSDDDEEAENVYLDIEVVLVTPLAKCGTLDSYLEDMELEWTEDDVVSIFQQVVTAVDALHSRTPSIVHRDIKAGNVFVDNDRPGGWVVMLGDLGSAQALDESGQVPVPDEETAKAVQADINANTTSTFRAPEQFHVTTDSQPLTTAVDMWGLGVLLYSMMFQIAPFESMKDLMAGKYELSSDAASLWSAPLLDVLHGTLQPDPAARWTTSTLLTHLDKYWPSHGKELVRAEYKRQRPATPPRDPSAPARPSRAAMRSKGRISSTRSIPRRPMGPVDPAELEAAKATGSSSKPRSRSSSKTGGSAKPKAPRPPSFDGSGIKFFDDDGKIGV